MGFPGNYWDKEESVQHLLWYYPVLHIHGITCVVSIVLNPITLIDLFFSLSDLGFYLRNHIRRRYWQYPETCCHIWLAKIGVTLQISDLPKIFWSRIEFKNSYYGNCTRRKYWRYLETCYHIWLVVGVAQFGVTQGLWFNFRFIHNKISYSSDL